MTTLEQAQSLVDASRARANAHPFFAKFKERKDPEQLRRFAPQWHIAATNHKIAFPYLIATTRDDQTRQELIEVLRDEYGNGNPDKIHAKLLHRFLDELGASSNVPILPEVKQFSDTTLALWTGSDPAIAFGYHYALEYIAMDVHRAFATGLEGYGLSPEALEYFRYHSAAEEEHEQVARAGFLRYAEDPTAQPRLLEGVRLGVQVLEQMWDGFNRHVFD